MSDLFWLSDAQLGKLERFFPKSHGKPRGDDKRVLSGVIIINRNGLRWRDAPAEHGPHKTFYSRSERWSEKGIFARMLLELADQGGDTDMLMIPFRQIAARSPVGQRKQPTSRRTARPPVWGWKRGRGRLIGRTKGGMNSKLHAVTDASGRPVRMFLTAGQRSDYIGARALLDTLPPAKYLLADRG